MKKTRVAIPCAHCSRPTERQPYQIKANATGRFFCNMKCLRAWEATTKAAVICEECGKEFERHTHHAERSKQQFCNRKCLGAWRTKHLQGENSPRWVKELAVKCDNCGKEFRQKARSRLERNGHNFCSISCAAQWSSVQKTGANNHNWKGGYIDYYGPNWYRQARAARKRDGYICRHCGKTQKKARRTLDVHHIIPFRAFGYVRDQNDLYLQANDLNNLITFCQQCHAKAEAQQIPVQPCLL